VKYNISDGTGRNDRLLLVSVFFLILSLLVVTFHPTLTGFNIFGEHEQIVSHELLLNKTYTVNTIEPLVINGSVTSIKLNGRYSGAFKLWINNSGQMLLLAESPSSNDQITGMDVLDTTENNSNSGGVESGSSSTDISSSSITSNLSEESSNNATETISEIVSPVETEPTENATENITENISAGNFTDNVSVNEPISNESLMNNTLNNTLNVTEPEIIGSNMTEQNVSANITEQNGTEQNFTQETSENITSNVTQNVTENLSENITENITNNNPISLSDECIDTCLLNINMTNATLIVELDDNSTVTIDSIIYTTKNINHPPMQIKNISDIYLNDNNNFSINLSEYFIDEDGNNLTFESNTLSGVIYFINNNIITYNISNTSNNYSMFIYVTDGENIITSNIFNVILNISSNATNETNVTIETTQYPARIGEPVKWIKRVHSQKNITGLSVDIPSTAMNVSVSKNSDGVKRDLKNSISKIKTTKIQDGKKDNFSKYKFVNDTIEEDTIILNDSTDNLDVVYYTKAPSESEKLLKHNQKEVTLSSDIHYINVTANATLPIEVKNLESISLKWKITNDSINLTDNSSLIVSTLTPEELSLLSTQGFIEREIPFVAYDTNNDSLYDTIEWVAPHLSNQTFEIIINILNVYSHPTLNGNWTIDFQTNGSTNLTITATNYSNYKEIPTTWTNNDETGYELKFLTITCGNNSLNYTWIGNNCINTECSVLVENYSCNETGKLTSKELKVGEHVLRFNYGNNIAYAFNNATVPPEISFTTPPTPLNNSYTTNTSILINTSINHADDLGNLIYNWNGTNYSLYNNSIVLMMNFDNNSNIGENANEATDISPYGNNGTITNAKWDTNAVYGESIHFTNAGDYITEPTNKIFYDINAPHATTFWFYQIDYTTSQYPTMLNLLGTQGQWYAIYCSNQGAYEGCSMTQTSGGANWRASGISGQLLGKWNFLAVVFDGVDRTNVNSWKIYLNGVSQTLSAGGSWTTLTNNVIGTDDYSASDTINGNLDDLTIWNRSLSAAEVQLLYNSNLNKYDVDKWAFITNQSNLTNGTYTYQVTAIDVYNNSNITDLRYINIGPSPPLPVINSIQNISSINPVESGVSIVNINFTVYDALGNSSINISTAQVVVNNSGISRQSGAGACSGIAVNTTAVNITCNVSMQYYDVPGIWSVNVSVKDNSGNYVENTSTTFTYNALYAISLNTNNLDFGVLNVGDVNKTTGALILNNTGNFNYTLVQLKAYNLVNGTDFINVSNFRVNITNISMGTSLINNTYINVTGAMLPRSTDSSIGNQSMYIYVDIPIGTSTKKFMSLSSWTLSLS